jgi:hypothetical protein
MQTRYFGIRSLKSLKPSGSASRGLNIASGLGVPNRRNVFTEDVYDSLAASDERNKAPYCVSE